ncbi:hypothetical protein TA3x_001179 [Tundrisphaera sp. TA3]|uniref:hypothetical protein n=1 Tax=Tundrisphaera sp. TA3 TaxID=3435775 RepID=UPI003EBCB747
MSGHDLTHHLMGIVSDATLRQFVYEHMGEYCHQCRNRLNSLKLCIYLAKRQVPPASATDLGVLEDRYAVLERSIDLIQTLCRPMSLSLASLGLDLLIQDRMPRWIARAIDLDVDFVCAPPTERAVALFDPDRLGQALDLLWDWRMRRMEPGSTVQFGWRVEYGIASVNWHEHPNGFASSPPPAAETDAWALPLITRVIEAHGGKATLSESDAWRLDLAWPIQATPSPA